jgi:diguanylate cyclase (GGDEF)-like protein
LRLVEELFQPMQSAFFHARAAERRLALAYGNGLPAALEPGYEVEYGRGKLGAVAERRAPLSRAELADVPGPDPAAEAGLSIEAAAPVVDESGDLIGVLTVAGPRRYRDNAKDVLSLLAGLAGMAVTHVTRLRATQQIADQDALTGTYSKRYVQHRLGDELERSVGEARPLSLLLLDIDHFKAYNDRNGHIDGDHVLKQVGQVLRSSIREDDTAGRYGGDEFLVLLPGATKDRALSLAEHLRQAVQAHRFEHGESQPLGALTISVGVATFPADGDTAVGLLRAADQALYAAKAAGRNRVETTGRA